MDHAVAFVQACLQINGYFTVAEYPVIEAAGSHQFNVMTDLDILAFHFPGAGRLVPGENSTNRVFSPDPELGVSGDEADMLIGEVKEGKAELNRNIRNPDVLRTVLARFGCCSFEHSDTVIQKLIRTGEALSHDNHRIRLMAFGSKEAPHSGFGVITLNHIIEFIKNYINEHWNILRHAQYKHPVLGSIMVMKKAHEEAERELFIC